MSCILRAYGKKFDVDLFIKDKKIEFTNVYRVGEPRSPRTNPDGPKVSASGFGVEVSDAEFEEFELQIKDAIAYLHKNESFINEVVNTRGVEAVVLDFGVETKEPFFSSYMLPSELTLIAGKLGINLCVSTYPAFEESDET